MHSPRYPNIAALHWENEHVPHLHIPVQETEERPAMHVLHDDSARAPSSTHELHNVWVSQLLHDPDLVNQHKGDHQRVDNDKKCTAICEGKRTKISIIAAPPEEILPELHHSLTVQGTV